MKKPAPASRRRRPLEASSAPTPAPADSVLLDGEALDALASTRDAESAYWLGAEIRADLAAVERSARGPSRGSRGTVYLLPGIMGSSLGTLRPGRDPEELWLNPVRACDIMFGALRRLALDPTGDPNIGALGVNGILWSFYKKLCRTLLDADYTVRVFAYDWRRGIARLGRELAGQIAADPSPKVRVVAHSMGGLVTRAALAAAGSDGLPKLERLVMLGTPNLGSFAPVEVFRGTYGLANWIALADLTQDKFELAQRIYTSFLGLTEMLPRFQEKVDYFALAGWPKAGVRPRPEVLQEAARLPRALAGHDARFTLVAGIDQATIVAATQDADGDFVFHQSPAGDGTVPFVSAHFDAKLRTFTLPESHGALPNNEVVRADIVRLLDGRTPEHLSSRLPSASAVRSIATSWSEAQLRRQRLRQLEAVQALAAQRRQAVAGRSQPHQVEPEALRFVLAPFLQHTATSPASPVPPSVPPAFAEPNLRPAPSAGESFASGASEPRLDGIVIGRRTMRRLDFELFPGSLTRANCRAYAVGIYQDVAVSGASHALDAALDGALSTFLERRMLGGRAGEIFTLPAGRRRLRTDTLLFAGLGPFDRCDASVQRLVAENLIRTLAAMHIEECACVLMGTSITGNAPAALEEMLQGFLAGLREADPEARFRRIVLCERDPERLLELRRTLLRLATSDLFAGVEVTFTDVGALPPDPDEAHPLPSGPASGVLPVETTPNYLLVRQLSDLATARSPVRATRPGAVETSGVQFQVSFLGRIGRAAVAQEDVLVDRAALDALLGSIQAADFDPVAFGPRLAELVLPAGIRAQLAASRGTPLTVIHDAPSARLPWELLAIPGRGGEPWAPALSSGLSRRYLAQNLSTAKWRDEDRRERALRILIVQNPTGDLPGAQAEGEKLLSSLGADRRFRLELIAGAAASKARLQAEFASGRHDVIHYAGHGYFDPANPSEGGLVCARHEVLTGIEVAAMDRLPALVFLNACEVGRVRSLPAGRRFGESTLAHGNRNISLAEAFMRGGVASFLSTYWPVDDAAAAAFAERFYDRLAAGSAMGPAVLAARQAVARLRSPARRDWADYLLYGSPEFRVKLPSL